MQTKLNKFKQIVSDKMKFVCSSNKYHSFWEIKVLKSVNKLFLVKNNKQWANLV